MPLVYACFVRLKRLREYENSMLKCQISLDFVHLDVQVRTLKIHYVLSIL